MIVLRVLIIIAIIIVVQVTVNDYVYGYNQSEYCHEHYANGTLVYHKMPMNMTMPVSENK
jgi:hypothetical protein